MRGTWRHQPPDTTQPAPADNTGDHVAAQVDAWHHGNGLLHPETAMEIAAYWQVPGSALAAMACTGTITHDLVAEIDVELTDTELADHDRQQLRALRAYVLDCTVTPWAVGQNTAGYLPEADPYLSLDYADAVSTYRDLLTEAPDQLADQPEDCMCVDGGEACEVHALDAEVGAYLHDDVPVPVGGSVHGPQRELAISLRADSQPLPQEYWVHQRESMTVRQYLTEYGAAPDTGNQPWTGDQDAAQATDEEDTTNSEQHSQPAAEDDAADCF